MKTCAWFLLPLGIACTGKVAPSTSNLSPKTAATEHAAAAAAANAVPLHASQNVTITVEPSDAAAGLIAAINAETTSVHVTMYLMTDYGVEDAIVAKAAAGLDVKVVLNQHNADSATTPANQKAFNWFQTHGVNVVWAPDVFTFTHEKCILLDGTSAWIMTMNTAHTSPINNREYLALDTDPDDVAEAEAIFEADYANTPITPSGHLVVSPVNSHDKIVNLLYRAWTSIDVEVEELSDQDVVDALCVSQIIGITSRVILADESLTNAQQHAVLELEQCGVAVVTTSALYIHAKAIVIDSERAYVGSVNFTDTSMDENRELGLITNNPLAVSTIATTVAADIAGGTPVPSPPACDVPADCANLTDACYEGMCQSSCVGDECRDGYICNVAPGRYSGACTLQTTLPCATATDCSAGLVCTNALCSYCQSDADCADGSMCIDNGLCQAPTAN